ncbi:MAG: KdsC family phosphatase [bacterium]
MQENELRGVLKKIRLTIFDVDGVLTDGRLYYGTEGEFFKVFNAKDGLGISRLAKAGHLLGIITGRESPFVLKRAKDLGIQYVYQGRMEKLSTFETLRKDLGLAYDQIAYMGDDFIDLPVLERVGLPACPKDAMPYVKERCKLVSQFGGGMGAARELCDLIWEAQYSC